MRNITKIFLHCSASMEGVNLTGNDIKRFHCTPVSKGGRGWNNPGYHYVVRIDGTVDKLLDEQFIANGVLGHNPESIHICYVGGLKKGKVPANTMTSPQVESITRLLHDLFARYPSARLYGHNEFDNKACPCFSVREVFPEFAR